MIGQRILKLQSGDRTIDVPVVVFQPQQGSDGTWFCSYEIGWPEGTQTSRAGGVDALQAVFLALQMIGADIYSSSYHKSGALFLDEPGQGYGFPVAVSLRDRLIGDDAKFL
jgi:hypothetical protein